MKSKLLALTSVAAVAVTCLAPVSASALIFDFSFGTAATGIVTGVIGDLADNATSAATSVQVTSNTAPGGFGVGEYVGDPFRNIFTVSAGVITFAFFFVSGSDNAPPAQDCCTLALSLEPGLNDGALVLDAAPSFVTSGPITFTPAAAVPGPIAGAGLPGLVMAFGGILGWRRLRKVV